MRFGLVNTLLAHGYIGMESPPQWSNGVRKVKPDQLKVTSKLRFGGAVSVKVCAGFITIPDHFPAPIIPR